MQHDFGKAPAAAARRIRARRLPAFAGVVLALATAAPAAATSTLGPSPPAAAVTRWLDGLWKLRFASRSGVSVTLGDGASDLRNQMKLALESTPNVPSSLVLDPTNRRVEVCFDSSHERPALGGGLLQTGCAFNLVLLARDAGPLPPHRTANIVDGALGLRLAQLRARFRADRNFDPKQLRTIASRGGTPLALVGVDEDPPPAQYDHGYQSYETHYYLLRDGVVVAHGYARSEN